jgi:hypothetical protein
LRPQRIFERRFLSHLYGWWFGAGVAQILAWGSSYYLPAVLAKPIADDTGWPLTWVVGGLSSTSIEP